MAGPSGPAESTELVGDPLRVDDTGREQAGIAAAGTVGTGLLGPFGTAIGAAVGAVGGAVSGDQDTRAGEADQPLGGEPASKGTGPLDPIFRDTMSR